MYSCWWLRNQNIGYTVFYYILFLVTIFNIWLYIICAGLLFYLLCAIFSCNLKFSKYTCWKYQAWNCVDKIIILYRQKFSLMTHEIAFTSSTLLELCVYPKRIFTAGEHRTEIPFPVTRYILRRGMGHNNIDYIWNKCGDRSGNIPVLRVINKIDKAAVSIGASLWVRNISKKQVSLSPSLRWELREPTNYYVIPLLIT